MISTYTTYTTVTTTIVACLIIFSIYKFLCKQQQFFVRSVWRRSSNHDCHMQCVFTQDWLNFYYSFYFLVFLESNSVINVLKVECSCSRLLLSCRVSVAVIKLKKEKNTNNTVLKCCNNKSVKTYQNILLKRIFPGTLKCWNISHISNS